MPNRVDSRPRSGSASTSGFTLLEVVVALAIASLALVGLFRVGAAGLFAADVSGRVEEAVELAQSHLAAVGRIAALAPGTVTGDDGDGYRWTLRVTPLRQASMMQQPSNLTLALYAVTVTISWPSNGRARSLTLETRRVGPSPAGK